MHRRLAVLVVMLFVAGVARAQSSPPPDQAEQNRILLERVQKLEQRLAEVEAKLGAATAPVETAANVPAAAKPESPEAATVRGPGAGHQHEAVDEQATVHQMEVHYPSLQIRGFGDVDFSATDQKGTNSGFNLGQLDLHLASALSRKVSYYGELTFNAQPTGYTVEVERSIIRYDYNDFFKVSFGRYHTPIGYWNTAFHHGAWLQTTIGRPDMIRIGGTFIPVHFVGLLVEGNIPSGGAGLSYSAGLGNGRGSIISRPGDAGDNNNNRAWVANLYSRPVKLYGLQMGVSLYKDKITLPGTPPAGNDFSEWISDAHIAWTKETPEFLAEFANVHHRNILTNFVTNSQAFYAQIAYRLPWLERSLKPYYRFEHTHMPLSEQVFSTNQDLVGSILGMRYDITNYAAFKGEYRYFKRLPTDPFVSGAFFQTDFTF
ncbi:MAG TPA: porin [Candidatus Acidoferrum sp.]